MDMDTQHQLRQLQQQLAAREQEVAALREIAEAAAQLQSQDVQAAKVMELSKKNRTLNLSLEKEKQKVAKLQQALSEATSGKATATTKQQPESKGSEASEALAKELAAAKERMTQMTNKMGQFEQKVFMLETENKKLVRALTREVGEETPLSKVLEEGTDWKGRREQIVHLKDTIRQLKESSGAATVPSSLAKHETQHSRVIEKMNKDRKAEMERMQAELDTAKKAAEQLRLQYAGASSRRKVLEDEVGSLKDKLAVVLNKTKNDDKLITALRSELSLASKGRGAGSGTGSVSDGLTELYELRSRCSQLEEQVEQQQKVIRYLQANGSAAGGGQMEQLQDENEELKQQIAALHNDLEEASNQRPGTSGMSSALRQQVLALQEENNRLRAEIVSRADSAAAKSPKLQLRQSEQMILQEAQEALTFGLDGIDEGLDAEQEQQ